MLDFVKEGEANEADLDLSFDDALKLLEELEFKNMLSGKEDSLSAVLTINSGAGGTESCDWANMLLRMYKMWADSHQYQIIETDYQEGDYRR